MGPIYGIFFVGFASLLYDYSCLQLMESGWALLQQRAVTGDIPLACLSYVSHSCFCTKPWGAGEPCSAVTSAALTGLFIDSCREEEEQDRAGKISPSRDRLQWKWDRLTLSHQEAVSDQSSVLSLHSSPACLLCLLHYDQLLWVVRKPLIFASALL